MFRHLVTRGEDCSVETAKLVPSAEWLDAKRAAAYLCWPLGRIYQKRHELPHVKHGGRLMFRRSALDVDLEQFEMKPKC